MDDYRTWISISGLIFISIYFIGYLSARKLPLNLRTFRVRKFVAIGLAVVIFVVAMNRPFVSSYSVSNTRELKMYPPSELEEIKEFQKEQSESVYFLKKEVAELKTDLYKVNQYYAEVTKLLGTTIIMMLLLFVVYSKPEEQEQELEEIRQDQIFKL